MRSHIRRFAGEIVVEIGDAHASVVTRTVRSKGKLIRAVFRIVDRLTPDAMRFASLICLNPSVEKVVIEIVGLLRFWLFFIRDAGTSGVDHVQYIISGNMVEY